MRFLLLPAALGMGLLCGCVGQSPIKPAELLDPRTGTTVGALREPIEFVQSAQNAALASGKRTSFAYLGPLEWDRSGDITYALWIHLAPGNDKQVDDIHLPGAVTLLVDDERIPLLPMDDAQAGGTPYRPVASWGQTGYFALDVAMLRRMAASRRLELDFRAPDRSSVDFLPSRETSGTLLQFLQARGITDD